MSLEIFSVLQRRQLISTWKILIQVVTMTTTLTSEIMKNDCHWYSWISIIIIESCKRFSLTYVTCNSINLFSEISSNELVCVQYWNVCFYISKYYLSLSFVINKINIEKFEKQALLEAGVYNSLSHTTYIRVW